MEAEGSKSVGNEARIRVQFSAVRSSEVAIPSSEGPSGEALLGFTLGAGGRIVDPGGSSRGFSKESPSCLILLACFSDAKRFY